jgi:hypothetical protein
MHQFRNSAMDHNYAPMSEIFREVIARNDEICGKVFLDFTRLPLGLVSTRFHDDPKKKGRLPFAGARAMDEKMSRRSTTSYLNRFCNEPSAVSTSGSPATPINSRQLSRSARGPMRSGCAFTRSRMAMAARRDSGSTVSRVVTGYRHSCVYGPDPRTATASRVREEMQFPPCHQCSYESI